MSIMAQVCPLWCICAHSGLYVSIVVYMGPQWCLCVHSGTYVSIVVYVCPYVYMCVRSGIGVSICVHSGLYGGLSCSICVTGSSNEVLLDVTFG